MVRSVWILALVAAMGAGKAWGEPYFAAWKGVNCNACHVNQTGGWIRNDFGKNYGNSLETFDWKGLSEAAQTVKHNTPTWVSVGLDVHESYGMAFDKDLKTVNHSFYPAGNSVAGFPYAAGRQSFSIDVRMNEAISGVLTYRLDESVAKEAYGLVHLPEGAYLKIGKFMAPYGLTLADDNSLVRENLGGAVFSFDNPTNDGLEVGVYPGIFFANAAVVNADTSQSQVALSAKGGFNLSEITLGGSFYGQNLDEASLNQSVRYGLFGWGRLGPAVLLGEFDSGQDWKSPTSRNNYQAYHGSAEFDLGNSVYVRAVSEWLDDSLDAVGVYEGFRHLLGLRFYPVRNLKCQVELQRYDPSAGDPYYALLGDAFIFY